MMANKQLRKMIICEIFRFFLDLQDNTTQYLERVWFDYCSVHVFTVISHVSTVPILVFFIVTQWVVSVQWNYFYKLEYLSLMVVQVHQMLKKKKYLFLFLFRDDCINIIHF
ncbi:hypothetical protein T07_1606 [Trichinella nelsoni]|uniref:Uncharacterized protein n=1 Tax=Trichinella nelsoni TaxID=6336 RepID=A0A0V0SE04_9BILA|nr:hypothetical protein T07_1606 [Trichinella nelsoni]